MRANSPVGKALDLERPCIGSAVAARDTAGGAVAEPAGAYLLIFGVEPDLTRTELHTALRSEPFGREANAA